MNFQSNSNHYSTVNQQFQPTLQKLPQMDTRKKRKHKKKKRGNAQVGAISNNSTNPEETRLYQDLSTQKSAKLAAKNLGGGKLPSMGMSVIRQQSLQPFSAIAQSQPPTLPTSTKSEKKLFVQNVSNDQRRRRRHRSSEDEPHETTPSISPSSSADKIYAPEYQDEDSFDDNLSENFQGKFQFDHLIQIPHFFT